MTGPARIAILGAGAMGSVYAGLLAEAGHEVLAITRDAAHARAIGASGLHLRGPRGDRRIALAAATRPEGPPADIVIVATKSADAAGAVRAAGQLIGPATLVLAIQNGLGAAEEIAAVLPPGRLAVGIAQAFGASRPAPGHARHENAGTIRLGAWQGMPAEALARLVAIWRGTGVTAEPAADLRAMQWEKLICNAAYSGVCAVSGLTVGEVMDSPDLAPVSLAAAREAHAVARARGVAVAVDDPVAHALAFGARVRAARPSVLIDLEAGRPTEIDYINGAVVREARAAGLDAPVNATLTALVRAREGQAARARA